VLAGGELVIGFTQLVFRANGDLYGVSEDTEALYAIDLETAAAMEVGPISIDQGGGCTATVLDVTGGDLAFDALDRLWLWNNTPGHKGLWEVNPANACALQQSNCPDSRSMSGLAIADHTSPSPTFLAPSAQDDRVYLAFSGLCPVNGEPGSHLMRLNGVVFDHTRGDVDSPYCASDLACGDADVCTADHCSPGGCLHDPVSCDDGDPCTEDACDPLAGCTFEPHSGACDDGNACTQADTCVGGVCSGTPVVVLEVQDLSLSRLPEGGTRLTWAEPEAELTYALVSGPISELGGPGGIPTATCLHSGLTDPGADDPRPDPAETTGVYYVVRPAGTCGVGSYGQTSAGTARTPVADCP
jgi:hypothetical protein